MANGSIFFTLLQSSSSTGSSIFLLTFLSKGTGPPWKITKNLCSYNQNNNNSLKPSKAVVLHYWRHALLTENVDPIGMECFRKELKYTSPPTHDGIDGVTKESRMLYERKKVVRRKERHSWDEVGSLRVVGEVISPTRTGRSGK